MNFAKAIVNLGISNNINEKYSLLLS